MFDHFVALALKRLRCFKQTKSSWRRHGVLLIGANPSFSVFKLHSSSYTQVQILLAENHHLISNDQVELLLPFVANTLIQNKRCFGKLSFEIQKSKLFPDIRISITRKKQEMKQPSTHIFHHVAGRHHLLLQLKVQTQLKTKYEECIS